MIQKSAQQHVPPQIKCILKDALSLFYEIEKKTLEKMNIYEMEKIYNFISGMPCF